MQSIAEEIGITTAQLSLAWLLSKRICVIPKSNIIQRQKENFPSKDAIYDVLHFSDDMDKISEGKDPSVFLLETAEESQEDANRLRWLVWNDDILHLLRLPWISCLSFCILSLNYLRLLMSVHFLLNQLDY